MAQASLFSLDFLLILLLNLKSLPFFVYFNFCWCLKLMLFVLDLPLADTFMIYTLFYFGKPISIFIDIYIEYGRYVLFTRPMVYIYKKRLLGTKMEGRLD